MIKKLSFSRKGMRKKIASLSLLALLLNATMISTLIPSNMLSACEDKTISVEPSEFENPECETENPNEWHFLINQIKSESDAPDSIYVTWSNTNNETILLDTFTGGVAHYRTTENSDSTVTSATAMIYSEWSTEGKEHKNGQFNLSHGPCDTPETEPEEEVIIVASKIVCDNEEDLPNWGGGGLDITEYTATDFIADNPDCHLTKDWYFQVGDKTAYKEEGGFYGPSSSDTWTTFGPTDEDGVAETTVDISNIAIDPKQLRLREVLQDGYIPFTYTANDNSNDVSAEFYCADDVFKYDNYDWITTLTPGETYYCVAFNAPIESDCTDGDEEYCYSGPAGTEGIGICQAGTSTYADGVWEECTGEVTPQDEICGDRIDNDCDGDIDENCYCDPIMARVVIDENESIGIDNKIYVGSTGNTYVNGEWFPVYENGTFYNDDDIVNYENVDGLALQRTMGTLRVALYRGANGSFRHLEGHIEFYNASIDSPLRDDYLDPANDNHLEYGFDGVKGDAGNDEVWIDNGLSHFYLGVTSGDDGYYTDYSSLPIGECKNSFCGDGIVNQSWEECDGTDGLFGTEYTCIEQCQFEEDESCSDLVLARVNVNEVWNDQGGNGDMTSDIYIGSATNSVPAGTWFELYHNGSYTNDADIYEDVPGLAIQRLNGSVRAVIYSSASPADIEHIDGNIEFYNANVIEQKSDDSGNNRLENGFDTVKGGAGDDEVWMEAGDDIRSYFWLTVNTADDGYYTDWEIIEDCIVCESELRVDITYFENFDPQDATLLADISDNVYVGNSLFGQSIVTIPLTTDDRTNAIIDALVSDDIPGLHIQRGEDNDKPYFEISAYGFNHKLTRESIKANTQLINATITSIENGPDGGYENPFDGVCGITEGDVENDLPGNDEHGYIAGANAGKMCSITNVHRDRIRIYYEPTQECGIYCGNGQIDSMEECDDGNNTDGDGCNAVCTAETPVYGPYCGDGIVNQDWEECDNNDPQFVGCSLQCQIMGAPVCSEDVFARVVITDVQNEENNADMTNNIYLGTDVLPIPHNVWFAVHYDDSYINDSDIDIYQDVPGLAVQRLNGEVRIQIYGSHPNDGTQEHVKGYLEFFNEEALYPLVNDTSAGNKMEGSDWNTTVPTPTTPITAGHDYAWIDGNKSHFWMTVTTADDGYFTPYEVPVCDECSIFGHKYDKTGIGLVDWIIGLAQIVECIEDEEWADSVVSYLPGAGIIPESQVPVGEFRGDSSQALGVAEDNDTYNFVSLGKDGGTLILEFDNLILNKAGNDIQIVETSFNNPTYDNYREKAKVYASQDAIDWSYLGIAYLDEEFDLDNGTLASDELTPFILKWAQYIKLVDESIDGTDGYDVDGVKALHCGNGTIVTTTTNSNGEYCFADVDTGSYILYEEMKDNWNIWKVMMGQTILDHSLGSFFDVFVEIEIVDTETITVDFYNEEETVIENQAPVITLTVNPLILIIGSSFDPYNGHATANDQEDGDITGDIVATGTVDTNTVGTYYVTYDVVDSENEPAETKTLEVIVEDGNNPDDPDVIINEIMQNPNSVSDSNGEWFELYNPSTTNPTILDGCIVRNGDGTDSFTIVSLTVPTEGYVVLSNNNNSDTNGGMSVDYEYPSGFNLKNTSDEVIIECEGIVIDEVSYDDGATFPDPTGASMSLCGFKDNSIGSNWQEAISTYGDGDKGTPGALNDICESCPVCGNGTIEGDEKCDDNNNDSFDGCSSSCQIESIFGYKFNDEDNNGADDSEPKLSNWTIELYDDVNMITPTETITSSEAATIGYYSFENLGEGDYWIKEIQQAGWIQTTPTTSIEVNSTATSTQQVAFGNRKTQCFDGIDNDGDTFIDADDMGCWTDENDSNTYDPNDDNEENGSTPVYQCSDGNDNDGDGLIDTDDPGCHTDWDASNTSTYVPTDNDEYHPYCGDGACNNNENCSTCSQDCGNCSGGGGGGIIYPKSIIITNEKVIYLGEGEAMVSWTTNIEATRQVAYGDDSISPLGVLPEYGYDSVNTESTDMTKEHSMIIAGLTDGIPYYFRPIADRNGSTGEVVGIEVSYKIGEVKGTEAPTPTPTECNYLLEYIKLGALNNPVEVKKLEWFLNEFEGESLAINGIYEQVDFDAVSRFQEKYLEDVLTPWGHIGATGYVYITTKKKINELYCQREFPLTQEQEAEVARFSAMFSSLAQGDKIPFEYDIFTPESYTEEGTSEYYEDESGEVAGDEDEGGSEEESEDESGNEEETEKELGYDETLLIDEDDNVLLIGGDEDEDDETSEDNSIVKAFKDFTSWIWLIVAAIIGIIAYFFLFASKQKKEEDKDGNKNEEKETEK